MRRRASDSGTVRHGGWPSLLIVIMAVVGGAAIPSPGVAAEPRVQAEDVASASRMARGAKARVEVTGLRSATGQVFANPDGSLTAEEHARPVRVRQRDGGWGPVNVTLRPNADGSLSPVAAGAGVRFSGGGNTDLVRVTDGEASLTLGWASALPAPVVAGDTATYPEVMPGVDLVARAEVSGFSQHLVVKTREAAANPALAALRLPVWTQGVGLRSGEAGSVEAADTAGRVVFSSGTSWMWDAVAEARAADTNMALRAEGKPGPSGTEALHAAAMVVEVSAEALTVRPDRAMLTDAATVFPVRIDPGFASVKAAAWSMVNKRHPGQSYWSYDRDQGAKVGYTSDGGHTYRSMFAFASEAFRGKRIVEANVSAEITHSWTCQDSHTQLFATGGFGAGTTWNTYAQQFSAGNQVASAASSACRGNKHRVYWTGDRIREITQAGADSGSGVTVGLKAADEGSHSGWKKFDPASAVLSVTYVSYPDTPASATTDGKACATGESRPVVGSTRPELAVTATHPDGGRQIVDFAWAIPGGPELGTARVEVDAGGRAPVRLPDPVAEADPARRLVHGKTYAWRAHAWAADTWSRDWSPWCEFEVDTSRPEVPPTVTSADGLYPSDGAAHGTVGRTGAFRLGAGGAAGVVGYEWGLSEKSLRKVTAPAVGGDVIVQATPPADDPQTLFVRSVNRAGNVSDLARYDFLVGPGTAPVASWPLTDASGVDTSGRGHDLRMVGEVRAAPGRLVGVGGALRLAGAGAAVTSGAVVDTVKSFTLAGWVRPEPGARTVLSAAGKNAEVVRLWADPARQKWVVGTRAVDGTGAPVVETVGTTAVRPGVWTHVAVTFDEATGEVGLWVNGIREAGAGTAIARAAGPVTLGGIRTGIGGDGPWVGDLTEVRVFDRRIADGEVGELAGGVATVGQWTFGEGSGTASADDSGYGRAVTLHGGARFTSGRQGLGALGVDGASGYAATAGPVVDTAQSFSVSTWVRLDKTGETFTAVGQDGTRASGFFLQYAGWAGRWSFALPATDVNGPHMVHALSLASPTVGEWTHLVGVYDAVAGQSRLYVNGVLQQQVAVTSRWTASGAVTIGRGFYNGTAVDFFPGALADVRVFAGALTQAEIALIRRS